MGGVVFFGIVIAIAAGQSEPRGKEEKWEQTT